MSFTICAILVALVPETQQYQRFVEGFLPEGAN